MEGVGFRGLGIRVPGDGAPREDTERCWRLALFWIHCRDSNSESVRSDCFVQSLGLWSFHTHDDLD